jgi:hypothetical protein
LTQYCFGDDVAPWTHAACMRRGADTGDEVLTNADTGVAYTGVAYTGVDTGDEVLTHADTCCMRLTCSVMQH